jgi:hypothetical protein
LQNRFANTARHFVKENKAIGGTYIYDYSTDMSTKPYTLTLRLAGETLSNEARARFYAEAEKQGISHSQLLFQEDATIEVRRLNETEIMRDWIASTEAQLRQREDSIRTLAARLEAYESQTLPTEQIAQELHAQWPGIEDVTLGRADSTVLLVMTSKPASGKESSIKEDDLNRIEKWLAVRLQTHSVRVYLLPHKSAKHH